MALLALYEAHGEKDEVTLGQRLTSDVLKVGAYLLLSNNKWLRIPILSRLEEEGDDTNGSIYAKIPQGSEEEDVCGCVNSGCGHLGAA